jgi:hypothetical protein
MPLGDGARGAPVYLPTRQTNSSISLASDHGSAGARFATAMSIYLFRAGTSRTFAYSLDVTGRNISPLTEQEKWGFERTVDAEQLKAHPEALQRIWEIGVYIFNCSCRAPREPLAIRYGAALPGNGCFGQTADERPERRKGRRDVTEIRTVRGP